LRSVSLITLELQYHVINTHFIVILVNDPFWRLLRENGLVEV